RLKSRQAGPGIEPVMTSLPPARRSVLYARPSYDSINEIAFNHFDALAHRRGTYRPTFQYTTQIEPGWVQQVDMALLVRPYQEHERVVLEQGLRRGPPVGVYLGGDFLNLNEYGRPFDYMAPGTPNRRCLVEMLERADAVWTTSRFIAESVQPLNPRLVPHHGAVPEEWLPASIRPRDAEQPIRI